MSLSEGCEYTPFFKQNKHNEFTDTCSSSIAIFVMVVVDFCLVISALHEQIYTEGRVFLSVSPPPQFHIGAKVCSIQKYCI